MDFFVEKASCQTSRCWVEKNLKNVRMLLQTSRSREGYILLSILEHQVTDLEMKRIVCNNMIQIVKRGCLKFSCRWLFVWRHYQRRHLEKLSSFTSSDDYCFIASMYDHGPGTRLKCFGIVLSKGEMSENELRLLLGDEIVCKHPYSGRLENYFKLMKKIGTVSVFGNRSVQKLHAHNIRL